MPTFVGKILRLFTKSSRLIDSFLNLELLQNLTKLITNPDFNISSDAYETFKEIFILKRENDQLFETFVLTNKTAILDLFDILGHDSNYFAKREGLKSLYELVCRFDSLRKDYTENKESLKFIMNTVLDQNKAI